MMIRATRRVLACLVALLMCLVAGPTAGAAQGESQTLDPKPALPPVIGVPDTGINPYHREFSAALYPDAAVLDMTDGFMRHPSEYIPGYPADAIALDLTLDSGFAPPADWHLFEEGALEYGRVYWVPGTKVVGLVVGAPETRFPGASAETPVLGQQPDDESPSAANGHGTGSASVAVGNTLGTCPRCLLFFQQQLDSELIAGTPWVDVASHSFIRANDESGIDQNAPRVDATRAAARRGQVSLFGVGNGIGTPFLLPVLDSHTYQDQGPSWVIQVGGTHRDTGRPLAGDGVSQKVSSYALGTIPRAASNSGDAETNYGGTSAATPITAGVFGRVLHEARNALADAGETARDAGVVASGEPVDGSPYLGDGVLTRAELLRVVLKTAEPITTDNTNYTPSSATQAPYHPFTNVFFEGYGTADADSAMRAVEVLLGVRPLPDRTHEDDQMRRDKALRDALWGPCGCPDERD